MIEVDKTKKYLIAIDIDDTLRTIKGKISKKNIKMIQKVVSLGNTVVICSGRPKDHAIEVANKIGMSKFLICQNGSTVYDIEKNLEIFTSKLNKQYLKEIVKYCFENDIKLVITKDNIDYVSKNVALKNQKIFTIEQFNNLIDNNDLVQCLVIDNVSSNIHNLKQKILDDNKFSIGSCGIYEKNTNLYWFSINNKIASKGNGLKFLANYLHIPMENTIAIGNDENDISMLDEAFISVVVDNASIEVKKHADYITKSCPKNGVAEFLKKLI